MATLTADPDFDAITLDQDEAPAPAVEKDKGEEGSAELEKLRQTLNQREAELAEIRKASYEHEQRAYKTEVESAEARAYAASLEHTALMQTKSRLDAEEERIRDEHAKAIEMADGKRAAELASRLGDLAYQRNVVQSGLVEAERNVSRATKARETLPEAPKSRAPVDPYESDDFRKLPSAAQDWLKANKDRGYLGPRGLSHEAMSAYHDALAKGFREDSPAFYEHMDKRLGHVADGRDDDEPGPPSEASKPQKSRVSYAAPVSRGPSSDSAAKPSSGFRLKAQYAELAERIGMTPEEYVDYAWKATQTGNAESRAQAKAHYKQIRG